MDVQNIEKLNQLISRTDMTGNEKVEWLIAFTENYQALQLHKTNVICSLCEGQGYTIEVQAECCGNISENGYCCNMPSPTQVQKQCYCDGGNLPI